jgi:hypothetical protein
LGEGCFLEQVAGYFKVRVVLGEGCFLEQVAGCNRCGLPPP